MTSEQGMRESRDIGNGITVHLVKPPGEKWRIDFFDLPIFLRQSGGGLSAVLPEGRLQEEKEFETLEDAVAYAKKEIERDLRKRSRQDDIDT